LTYPSEKYEFVSWDDDIPNIWENNPNVPNYQAVKIPLESHEHLIHRDGISFQ
jgi:hypothetical protein